MFGSEIVGQWVAAALSGEGAVTGVVADRIHNLSVLPAGALPAVLHYAEGGPYDGPISGAIAAQTVRYVVRVVCEGPSTDPILPAAKAALALVVTPEETEVVFDGDTYLVTPTPVGEWPLTTLLEGGQLYRQLGFYVSFDVVKG